MKNSATIKKNPNFVFYQIMETKKKITKNKAKHALRFVLLVFGAFVMVYPLLWMMVSAFRPEHTIFNNMGLIPHEFTFENFAIGWQSNGVVTFARYFRNSFVISGLSVLGTVFSSTLAGYAFARLDFKFKGLFFALMMLTMMIPQHATIVPQFVYFTRLGWNNTIFPLVLPRFLAVDGFFIFLMMQFIRGLPKELDEAATIDGCGKFGIFFKIILPLTKPALITTIIFSFIWSWNDFLNQLIYLREATQWTVTLGLRLFIDETATSAFGAMFAMSALSLLPTIILFIFFQKYLVEGVATTGMK